VVLLGTTSFSAGGSLSATTKLQEGKDVNHRFPSLLPDGKHFLFIS
jgi:hypothetical protein